MTKRIIHVDTSTILGEGLKLLIKNAKEFEVSLASSSKDLFAQIAIQRPDLIILNLLMPKDQLISIYQKLNQEYSDIKFIVIAANNDEYIVLESVFKGARGVIWSETSTEEFIGALHTVLAGDRYLKIPESRILKQVVKHAYEDHMYDSKLNELSNREQEVLKFFVKGLSYKEIASNLNISPRTVESHKNNILSKLELSSVNEMIKYAIKHGLIEF